MPPKKPVRSDGRYKVTLDIGRTPEGKRIQKSFYGKTQREANAKKREYEERLAEGANPERMTVAQWAEQWLPYSSTNEEARRLNQRYLNKLLPQIGHMQLAEVRQIDIQRFAASLSSLKQPTVNAARRTACRLFKAAAKNNYIKESPCEDVVWEGQKSETHRMLEEWEKLLILRHWNKTDVGIRAMIMLFTGCRIGEALALEWEDIDFENNLVRISKTVRMRGKETQLSTPKTEAGNRTVPLLKPLREALESLDVDRQGIICKSRQGGLVGTGELYCSWDTWIRNMENIANKRPIDGIRPRKRPKDYVTFSIRTHDLRHTYCTMLYEAGVGLKEAQYLMGHADAEMTLRIYTHLSNNQLTKANALLASYTEKWYEGQNEGQPH